MARIKIQDLPKSRKITRGEMRRVCGGYREASLSSLGEPDYATFVLHGITLTYEIGGATHKDSWKGE